MRRCPCCGFGAIGKQITSINQHARCAPLRYVKTRYPSNRAHESSGSTINARCAYPDHGDVQGVHTQAVRRRLTNGADFAHSVVFVISFRHAYSIVAQLCLSPDGEARWAPALGSAGFGYGV